MNGRKVLRPVFIELNSNLLFCLVTRLRHVTCQTSGVAVTRLVPRPVQPILNLLVAERTDRGHSSMATGPAFSSPFVVKRYTYVCMYASVCMLCWEAM